MIALQIGNGVYASEPAHHPDESAHYITALAMRDYALSGASLRPIPFAENYYVHYPKIAFGMWPPLFHVLLAIWLLPTHDGRISALALGAFLQALTALMIYRFVQPQCGRVAGWVSGALFVCLPLSQLLASQIMADGLVAFLAIASAWWLSRYLRSGRTTDAAVLGVWLALGCLAKGNGTATLLSLPIALVLGRRLALVRTPGPWIAAGIVVVLAAPWQLRTLMLCADNSTLEKAGWAFTTAALSKIGHWAVWMIGPVVGAFVLLGIASKLWLIRERSLDWEPWCALLSVAIAGIAFHAVFPAAPEPRYAQAFVAPLIAFAIPGLTTLIDRLSGKPPSRLVCSVGAVLVLLLYWGASAGVERQTPFGFRDAAQRLMRLRTDGPYRALVLSNAQGEGAFISEVASTDQRRPGNLIVRGTKLLVDADWKGRILTERYGSGEEALHDIELLGLEYIILDRRGFDDGRPFATQLLKAIDRDRRLEAIFTVEPAHDRLIEIYRVVNAAAPPARKLQYFMGYTLRRSLTE